MRGLLLGMLLIPTAFARAADGGICRGPEEQLVYCDDPSLVVPDAGAPAIQIEGFEPVDAGKIADSSVEQFEAPGSAPTVQVHGHIQGLVALDTGFESPPKAELAENVWDTQWRARLAVDVKLTPWLRLFVEGKAWVRGGSQRDFDRAKAFFEPSLGEAFLDLYTSRVDFRVGNQRIVLGANPALAPADALNPKDYRTGFLSQDPDDAVLPVFAIRAQGEIGRIAWMAAYAPFFTPSRFVLFGQDEGFLQPALGPALPTRRIDPTVEDLQQEPLLETKRPPAFLGDVAIRLVSTGRFKVGASWAWINEKLPQVTIDPELAALLAAQATGRREPAVALSVQNRLAAGEVLFRGEYLRQHIFSVEGSTLIGPGQLDLDVSFSPRQTFFDAAFAPINKSSVTWVLGYSQAQDSPWIWSVNYMGMAIPDIGAKEQVVLLEPATAVGAPRIAFLHLFLGSLSYRFWKDRFVVEARAAFEPIQRSYSLAPRVTWQGVEKLKVWIALEVYDGSPYSPLGYFGRNDQVVLGARYELF